MTENSQQEVQQEIQFPEISEIHSTTDYNMFIIPRWQRKLYKSRVDGMVARMSKVPREKRDSVHALTPIIVIANDSNPNNVKYVIADGQHRYSAWKQMGEKVYYVVSNHGTLNAEMMMQMNCGQNQWSVKDSIMSYIGRNREPYIWLSNLVENNNLHYSFYNLFVSSKLSEIETWTIRHIRNGDFNPSLEFRTEVEKIVSELVELRTALNKDGVYISDRIHFQKAYVAVRKHPQITFERIMKQFIKRGTSLRMRGSYVDMVQEIVDIVNYGSRVRIKVSVTKKGVVTYDME